MLCWRAPRSLATRVRGRSGAGMSQGPCRASPPSRWRVQWTRATYRPSSRRVPLRPSSPLRALTGASWVPSTLSRIRARAARAGRLVRWARSRVSCTAKLVSCTSCQSRPLSTARGIWVTTAVMVARTCSVICGLCREAACPPRRHTGRTLTPTACATLTVTQCMVRPSSTTLPACPLASAFSSMLSRRLGPSASPSMPPHPASITMRPACTTRLWLVRTASARLTLAQVTI
mmetsp:Transcript_32936/g.76220  ORF Transcript_32936/g.76220 Transcript_32936/m.76220 type:complete len:232 (+) Transcript_32936:368-1063(+)